jgi:FG-GAP-like repeat
VYWSGRWSEGLVAADLNADGIVDVATENQSRRELVVLLGTGGGRFAPARRFTGDVTRDPADAGFRDIAVGDVNGDGKPDAVLVSSDTRLAVVRLGNGDGTFGPESRVGSAAFGNSVTLADLNHDSKLDVVASLVKSKTVTFLGNGEGTFGATAGYVTDPGEFLMDVTVSDFDGDGNTDLATMSLGNDLFMRLGAGDGALGALRTIRIAPNGYEGPISADFNRDGRPDLAYLAQPSHSQGGVSVLLNWSGLPAPPCVPGFLSPKPLRAAKRDIHRAACRLGRFRYRYSRTIRKHRVISQRPRSGTFRPNRARVSLVASLGRRH